MKMDIGFPGGAKVEARDRNGRTAFIWAAAQGQPGTLQTLLAHGADVEAADGRGRTALIAAAGAGQLDAVKLLLEAGARRDVPDEDGVTARLWAENRGYDEIAELHPFVGGEAPAAGRATAPAADGDVILGGTRVLHLGLGVAAERTAHRRTGSRSGQACGAAPAPQPAWAWYTGKRPRRAITTSVSWSTNPVDSCLFRSI